MKDCLKIYNEKVVPGVEPSDPEFWSFTSSKENEIQTKSNWDFEEEWDYTATEQTKAKPKELIKASSNDKGHKRN